MCTNQCKIEHSENNLFTWISGVTAIFGIITTVYSMVNLNSDDESSDSEKNHTHVKALVLYFVVAAFIGIVQTSFSILPICKILCRSTWKWVNFIGGFGLIINSVVYISLNVSTNLEYMGFWIWIFLDGLTMMCLTVGLCCRDYKINQSIDMARKDSLRQESRLA